MAASKTGIRRIAIGVDGSESSAAAIKWAIRLAKATGSQAIAVYAIDIPVYFPEPEELPFVLDDDWRAGMKSEFEDKWCKPLKVAGVRYRTVMEDGRGAGAMAAGRRVTSAADLVVDDEISGTNVRDSRLIPARRGHGLAGGVGDRTI